MTRPWLVADIGGTNARFALLDGPGAPPERLAVLPTAGHAGLTETAAAYLERHASGVRPAAACLAVAGPVAGGRFRLTNAGWPADTADSVAARLGIPHVDVINDFEALARALPVLGPADVADIGPPVPSGDGPLAVVGPGTGLGTAGLVRTPSGWVPLPGEGGQVDAPAATDREIEVVRLLRAEHGSGAAELLLSGNGLARLYRYLAALDGDPARPLTAAQICAREDDRRCAEAVAMFCALLGSYAGNVALTLGARGGVHLGGGILPRIAGALRASAFRTRFEAKPPVAEYLAAIPTRLIVHPGPALAGAAAKLALEAA
ncbi:Glucokinase [Actinomadura rubteroloni]|uniref:Glucokinase n=1 Tax=Actinomadura rubteroloni TaxID=1926885 RepID=A0A2P4UD05_9ACTN|nr:glucokinase [Actinomadura rubteroloni]POM22912.1 Glucokinase [Actinomadura rubteroloni]